MPYKNIDPTIWGPPLWKFMHYFTLSYPENPTEEDKDNLYNFFLTIQTVLPCEKCRYNFKSHLEKTPLTEEIMSSNIKVVRWLFDIHNEVNKTTNKPVLLYDDFIKIYSTKPQETKPEITKPEITKPQETISEVNKPEVKSDEDKISNNFSKVLNYFKNNKLVLILLLIIIILIMVYINKKY